MLSTLKTLHVLKHVALNPGHSVFMAKKFRMTCYFLYRKVQTMWKNRELRISVCVCVIITLHKMFHANSSSSSVHINLDYNYNFAKLLFSTQNMEIENEQRINIYRGHFRYFIRREQQSLHATFSVN